MTQLSDSRQAGAFAVTDEAKFSAALALMEAVGDGVSERTAFSVFEHLVAVVSEALLGDRV